MTLSLTPSPTHGIILQKRRGGKFFFIPEEEMEAMKGKVYPYREKWRVRFKGSWFTRDEHGQLLYHERQAWNFLEYLNQLDKEKRYDPSLFKGKTPYRFDAAWKLYYESRINDSEWYKGKKYICENYLKSHFQNCDIREIRQIHIQGLINFMRGSGRCGDKRIKDALGVLHAFLNYYKESLPLFPAFPEHSYQKPAIQWLTEKEVDQIFEFVDPPDIPIFSFLKSYATRPEEACGLLRSKVNWETMEITIDTVLVNGRLRARTKQKRTHKLPIIPEMVDHLKPKEGKMYIFKDRHGEPYNTRKLETRWNRATKLANQKYGTRKVTLYKLRHSWASQRRKQGFTLEQIGSVLGHSDQRVTRGHYADIGAGELVSIVRGKK
jgi:integrase